MSPRKNTLWIVAVIIVAGLLCCSTATGTWLLWSKLSSDDGGEDPNPSTDENVGGEMDPITFEYSVLIVNDAPVEMCAVYVSPVEDDDWGASRGRIPAGDSLVINVPAGRYDVLAVDCDDAVHHATQIASTDCPTVIIGGTNKVQLHIQNNSSHEVCYLQASFTFEQKWGEEDLLGEVETISPHTSRYVYLYPGDYDLRALDCHGATLFEQQDIALEETSTWILE